MKVFDFWETNQEEQQHNKTKNKQKLYLIGLKSLSLQLILELVVSFSPISHNHKNKKNNRLLYLLPIHPSFFSLLFLFFLPKEKERIM